jgi:hypothetical protein
LLRGEWNESDFSDFSQFNIFWIWNEQAKTSLRWLGKIALNLGFPVHSNQPKKHADFHINTLIILK